MNVVQRKLSFPHAGYQRDGVEQLVSLCLEHSTRDSSPDTKRLVQQLLDTPRAAAVVGTSAAEAAEAVRGAPAMAACVAACHGILTVCLKAPGVLPPRDALDALLATAASPALPAGSWTGVAHAVIELRWHMLQEQCAAASPHGFDEGQEGEGALAWSFAKSQPGAVDPLRALLATRPHECQQLLHDAEAMIGAACGKLTEAGGFAVALQLAMWSPVLGAQLVGGVNGDSGPSSAALQMLVRVCQALADPTAAGVSPCASRDVRGASEEEERAAWASRLWHLRRARGLLAAAAAAVHLVHNAAQSPASSAIAAPGASIGTAAASFAVDATEVLLRGLELVHNAALQAGEEAEARGVSGAALQGVEEGELAWAVVGGLLANEASRLALLAVHATARNPSASATTCAPTAPALLPALRALQQVSRADAGLLATPCCIAALAGLLSAPGAWATVTYGYGGSSVRAQVLSVVEVLLKWLHAANDGDAEGDSEGASRPADSVLQPCTLRLSHVCLLGAPLAACVAGDSLSEAEGIAGGREQYLADPLLVLLERISASSIAGLLQGGRLQPHERASLGRIPALLARSEALLGTGIGCGGGPGAAAAVHCAALCATGGRPRQSAALPHLDFDSLAFMICCPAADAPPLSQRWRCEGGARGSLHGVAAAGAACSAAVPDDRFQAFARFFEHDDDGTWEEEEEEESASASARNEFAGSWLYARQQRRRQRRKRLQEWLSEQQQPAGVAAAHDEPENATVPAAIAALLFSNPQEGCSQRSIDAGLMSALARLRPVRALHEGVVPSLIARALGKERIPFVSAAAAATAAQQRYRVLYELPRLATHAAAQRPILSTIKALRNAAKDANTGTLPDDSAEPAAAALFHALALRLRCRLWLTCNRGFGQLEDAIAQLLAEAESVDGASLLFPSILELRLSASACAADVCAFNAHRGTALVSQLQQDLGFAAPLDLLDGALHKKAASVVSMSLGSLASLVTEDELDFFAAFSLVVSTGPSTSVAYFDNHALLHCFFGDDSDDSDGRAPHLHKCARSVVLLAMIRFIAAGAEQVGEWAQEQLSGVEAGDSRSKKHANVDAVGGWEAGSWAGFGLSPAMTTEQSTGQGPEADIEVPHGVLAGPVGIASRRAVAMLWRVALARCRDTTGSCKYLNVPAEIRGAALFALNRYPLGVMGLLPPPVADESAEAVSSTWETGASRMMSLLQREVLCGAVESCKPLILLLGRAITAEVACRGRWTFLCMDSAAAPQGAAATPSKGQTREAATAAEQAAEQWRLGDEAFKSGDHAAADAAYARSVKLSKRSAELRDDDIDHIECDDSSAVNQTRAKTALPTSWAAALGVLRLPCASTFRAVLVELQNVSAALGYESEAGDERNSVNRAVLTSGILLEALALVPCGALPALLGPLFATTIEQLLAVSSEMVASSARRDAYIASAHFVCTHSTRLTQLSDVCAALATPVALQDGASSWTVWESVIDVLPSLLAATAADTALRVFQNLANKLFTDESPSTIQLSTAQHQLLQLKLLWALDTATAITLRQEAATKPVQGIALVSSALSTALRALVEEMVQPIADAANSLHGYLVAVWEDGARGPTAEWEGNADDIRFSWSDGGAESRESIVHARLVLEALAACCVRQPLSSLGLHRLVVRDHDSRGSLMAAWWSAMLVCRVACACTHSLSSTEDLMPMLHKCRAWQLQSSTNGLCAASGPSLIPALACAVVARLRMDDAAVTDVKGLHRWVLDCLDSAIVGARASQQGSGGQQAMIRALVLAASIAFEVSLLAPCCGLRLLRPFGSFAFVCACADISRLVWQTVMPDVALVVGLSAGEQHPSDGAGFKLAARLGLGRRSSVALALLPQTLAQLVLLASLRGEHESEGVAVIAEQVISRLLKVRHCAIDVVSRECAHEVQSFVDAVLVPLLRLAHLRAAAKLASHMEQLIADYIAFI